MPETSDYYRLLHIDPDAPVEIIRSSYRTMMQRLKKHPDLGGDHRQAALINEAYAVLTDPARRAEYDREYALHYGRRRSRRAAQPWRPAPAGTCLFCGTAHGLDRPLAADDCCRACETPLFRAEHLRLDASGQRLLERVPREMAVTCYTEWPQPDGYRASMRDLSLNGMQIASGFPIEGGCLVKVDSSPCQALARVAWCTATAAGGEWLIGLEFVTLRFHRSRGSFVSAEA